MSGTFNYGDRLYTQDGNPVEFSHAHDQTGYVYPILTTRVQVVSHRGDDFDEVEDEALATYLLGIPLVGLFTEKPIAQIDAEIIVKRAEMAEMEKAQRLLMTQLRAEANNLDRDLRMRVSALEKWREKYGIVDDAVRFLEGHAMFPLETSVDRHGRSHLPVIPDMTKAKFLRLRVQNPPRSPKSALEMVNLEWTAVKGSHSGDEYGVPTMFFPTEEARIDHIIDLFGQTCARFRKAPNYKLETYSDLTYGVLQNWTARYPFLSIPDDILAGRAASEAAEREATRVRLEEQLAGLTGTSLKDYGKAPI